MKTLDERVEDEIVYLEQCGHDRAAALILELHERIELLRRRINNRDGYQKQVARLLKREEPDD